MIKILIHKPPYYKNHWWGAEHIYRFGFVWGMRNDGNEIESILKHPEGIDINYVNGFIHGYQYHKRYALKALIRGTHYDE